MSEVFLEVYELSGEEAKVPTRSAICLFLLRYLQHPPNISLSLVMTEQSEPSLDVSVEAFKYRSVAPESLCSPVSDCRLPVLTTSDSSACVAGLCAVLRQVVKHSGGKWRHLLGFREGCLFACAEVSLWTKFCEIDIVQVVNDILLTESNSGEIKISEHLARFEEHLKQPVRMHNIDKLRKKIDYDYVEHAFSEGPSMSLADLIILPCINVVLRSLPNLLFSDDLPLIVDWYQLILNEPYVKSALNFIREIRSLNRPSPSINYMLPQVPEQSLYKSDPKRYKPKLKQFTRQEDVEEALRIVDSVELNLNYDSIPFGHEITFDWETVSVDIQPDVPQDRLERKLQQLENLAKAVIKVAKPGDRIVDFCCGSGHLGIILAHCLPECQIVLLDNKEQSLDRAKSRVNSLGLSNIVIIQSNLDYFKGSFQIGVSLHACGVASDLVIESCLQCSAAFVVCPCCYGFLQSNHVISYPRSDLLFNSLPLRYYLVLGHCADQTHKQTYAKSEQGERCMAAIDSDRCLNARDRGYTVSLAKLLPHECSPKNNLLVGLPKPSCIL